MSTHRPPQGLSSILGHVTPVPESGLRTFTLSSTSTASHPVANAATNNRVKAMRKLKTLLPR